MGQEEASGSDGVEGALYVEEDSDGKKYQNPEKQPWSLTAGLRGQRMVLKDEQELNLSEAVKDEDP